MSITELCAHVGAENIQVQALASSMTRAQVKGKDGEITFATDREKVAALAGVGIETHRCVILWLPIDKLPK